MKRRRTVKIDIQPFQRGFYTSTARFPGFVAAWGTGKTMTLILKGMTLSTYYPTNLGLICRKTFRSLQKSTIKDFTRYTGLKVPSSSQEVLVPGTESSIMFQHAENAGELWEIVQNMNLGWFGIEQGDELDTAEVFDMLRGRLRRILTPNDEIQDKLIALGVLSERCVAFEDFSKKDRTRIEKAIVEKLGIPVRQGIVIANTAGHNWMWHRWKYEKWPEYELHEAVSKQNEEHIPEDTLADWERLKVENPRKHNQYVKNSWEDYDLEGAFYAALMSNALKAERVGLIDLYDRTAPVYPFWDLGIRATDTTAIWFVQFIKHNIHLIDYYENYGEGIAHYSAVLGEKKYTYGAQYLPPDVITRMQAAEIENRYDLLKSLRREPIIVVKRHRVAERIEATRNIINRCMFDANCRVGVEALNHYRKKRNPVLSTELKPVFQPEPLHDWASNGADAFGLIGIVYRHQTIGGKVLGSNVATQLYEDHASRGVTNLLKVG